jgi:hypothetical protein
VGHVGSGSRSGASMPGKEAGRRRAAPVRNHGKEREKYGSRGEKRKGRGAG